MAERLSDKMEIMMLPMDGRNFFANDIFRAASTLGGAAPSEPEERPAKPTERVTKVTRHQ